MIWSLGIDTSSIALSVGLYKDTAPFLSNTRYEQHGHSRHIVAMVRSLFSAGELSMADISRVGITTGPGSFTGLRVGIAFVKGLCMESNTPIYSFNTLEIIANSLGWFSGVLGIALDARQDHVFFATYTREGSTIVPVQALERIPADSFYTAAKACDTVVYDTMGFTRSTVFSPLPDITNTIDLAQLHLSRGLGVAKCAAGTQRSPLSSLEVCPDYMQESYAERNRPR
ncbi:tRNA (adenosine(37)-N6)-threonylcarbamoyltransferase complex dimerization subunit type 1 TsaB [Chitinivibrio alkaliphilus]|uniref:Putative molecular chaperone n=1 Tax=Chitinivibrio alkaliphilus ACht1 TaxID=1313304 RepID=U7DBN8_9BACT|nr:tRNA (adenosine(37)-N6)-threonylcarbamoyltransferase complex dimerization subunit type 1 TsaB [Chitinivibrio alkaliphilus]ERP38998.1 putative molecular chaperone [Chitinivibrio alkaliphilus ACht1]